MSSSGGVLESEFWNWCTSCGVASKQVSLKAGGGGGEIIRSRGLFAETKIKHGAVVIDLPFSLCPSVQTIPLRRFGRCLPSPLAVARLGSRHLNLSPFECSYLWLSAAMALMAVQHGSGGLSSSSFFTPYLAMLPKSIPEDIHLSAREYMKKKKCSVKEQEEYHSLEDLCRNGEKLVHSMIHKKAQARKFSGTLPNLAAVRWAHRAVLSRAFLLPSGCHPSAPDDLASFMEEHQDLHVLPAMVPFADFINSAEKGTYANCELYTCKKIIEEGKESNNNDDDVDDNSDGMDTGLSQRIAASAADRRRIVVCARGDIAAGEELTLPYDLEDRVVSLVRYGFC